jgi:PhnB protein
LNFYSSALGAEIKSLMRVKDGPKEYHQPGNENKVMHAEMKVGAASIFASDNMGHDTKAGSNCSLNLNYEEPAELEKAWSKMTEGARITMPLQDTFWGAKFGTLQDKYGINWMFNCEKKK